MEHKYIVVRTSYTPYGEKKEVEDRVFSDRLEAEKYVEMFNQICESNISYSIRKVNVGENRHDRKDIFSLQENKVK